MMFNTAPVRVMATVLLVLLSVWPRAAIAEQFTCIDQDYIHNDWYYHESFPWQPDDWTSPTNFAAGTAHYRVEVRGLDTPIDGWYTSNSNEDSPPNFTAEFFAPQLCLFQDAHIPSQHACFFSGNIMFNGPGIYFANQPLPDMYQYGVIDWTRRLMNPMIIGKTRDPSGFSFYGQNVDLRFTVIVVAPGDSFEPPAWWEGVSEVTDPGEPVPARTRMVGNYPNPFNPGTTIEFELAEAFAINLRVFDLAGRAVRTLTEKESLPAGRHEVVWRGRDGTGQMVPGGVYFVILEAGAVRQSLRVTLLK
jgi:hypothetical protein